MVTEMGARYPFIIDRKTLNKILYGIKRFEKKR